MKALILFDSVSGEGWLQTGWGLSILVGDSVLFDTGDDGDALMQNIEALQADTSRVETVVISHEHDDHTGGLWEFLRRKPRPTRVVGCPSFSEEFRRKVRAAGCEFAACRRWEEISAGVFTTGELASRYRGRFLGEQSLVVRGRLGLAVLTGCAHPGIPAILASVREALPADCPGNVVEAIVGGFHLASVPAGEIRALGERMKVEGIGAVGPVHCSGETAQRMFQELFGSHPSAGGAGAAFDV